MRETRTVWRAFLASSDPKQEAWLESMARQGWHLTGVAPLRFFFERGAPSEARYRVDFQMLRSSRREEYLQIFRDGGWDLLGRLGNRYYFRARPDALSPEIHSDPESLKGRIRRELIFMGILLAAQIPNLITSLDRTLSEPRDWGRILMTGTIAALVLLILRCMGVLMLAHRRAGQAGR